jgi:hypothetical protein
MQRAPRFGQIVMRHKTNETPLPVKSPNSQFIVVISLVWPKRHDMSGHFSKKLVDMPCYVFTVGDSHYM